MDFGYVVLNPVFSIFNRFLSWSFTVYGVSFSMLDVLTFSLLVGLFFIVINFIGSIA